MSDNPLAFPASIAVGPSDGVVHSGELHPDYSGMTLRDWFAGQALSYVAEFHGQDLYKPNGPRDIASRSYAIADAMLAERQP